MPNTNSIVVQTNVPSSRPGMGTIPFHPHGVAFRVWAPFATAVSVIGDFNNWDSNANPLYPEGSGYWSVDVPGATIGHKYKFCIHDMKSNKLERLNPYATEVANSNGPCIIHDPNYSWDANVSMPPWNELVIYEMHIGTFLNTSNAMPGTFANAAQKLGYLRDLGVNAIEIMPVAEFPWDFSWGYNTLLPFSVESSMGGPQGLQQLVDMAHAHQMVVILDIVINHYHWDGNILSQFDGWLDNNHGDGIYFYDNNRKNTPWGPRPDYGRGEVRQFLRDNALFWLNKYRFDGLRFDATAYVRNCDGNNNDSCRDLPDGWGLMQWINNEIQFSQPWKITIAEDLKNNEWITKDTGAGGAGFGAQWDAGFVHPIREAVISREDAWRNMYAVRDALCHTFNGDAFQRVIYTESHDEVANGKARIPEDIWPGSAGSIFSKKRSTLGAGLVFTAPGIPMIFQGQEFLEDEWFRDKDPLDWNKLQLFAGINQLYRDLIRLRRNWHNNTRGLRGQHINVHHVNNTDKLIAYHRWENGGPGDDVIVVANFANRGYGSYTLGLPRSGQWRVRFNSDWSGYDPEFNNWFSYDTMAQDGAMDNMPFQANVGIGPYSMIIMSQE